MKIIVKIPESVFKLPVHEALIEMLNISREQASQHPDWEDDSHPGFLKKSENTSKTEEIHSNLKKEGE